MYFSFVIPMWNSLSTNPDYSLISERKSAKISNDYAKMAVFLTVLIIIITYGDIKTSKNNFLRSKKIVKLCKEHNFILNNLPDGIIIQKKENLNSLNEMHLINKTFKSMFGKYLELAADNIFSFAPKIDVEEN